MWALRRPVPGLKAASVLALSANAAILLAWGWTYRPVYGYLRTIFTRQEFRTNQIVLLLILALIIYQARRGQFQFSLFELPQFNLPGIALALGGSLGFMAAEHWLDINTLSATLFGVATYGLLSLWMDAWRWRQGLPAALLLVGALPFGEHLDTFIGFPLRLATARIVGQGLSALGRPNVGVDAILVFESGLLQVDSPCSGVKSLWTGGLFFLAAAWIEQRPITLRWLLAGCAFALLLAAANLGRVAALTLAGPVAGWQTLAEMLHIPLGVIGFVAACAGAVWMLRRIGNYSADRQNHPPVAMPRPRFLAPALVILLAPLSLIYTPPAPPPAVSAFEWQAPAGLTVQEWPLTQTEQDWLSDRGSLPVSATRWRFQRNGLSGALLFVASDTWRAQHRPERCFTVYGLEVQESRLYMAAPDFPTRWLTLGKAQDERTLYTAGYWLQSAQRVTDDYSVRIWDDLTSRPQPSFKQYCT